MFLKMYFFMNGLFGILYGAIGDSIDVFNFWDFVINILAGTFVFVKVYLVNWTVKTLCLMKMMIVLRICRFGKQGCWQFNALLTSSV